MSLQIGKELFDITQTIDTSGSVSRKSVGGSQPVQPPPIPPTKAQGLTYLVAQHKRAEILQCEAVITGYMGLQPIGMQSHTHNLLVGAVTQKHVKVARLRMAPDPTTDPEREKMELMKQASKKQSRRARAEDDGMGGGRRKRAAYHKRSGDDYLFSDDDEDEVFGGASEDEYGATPGHRSAKRRKSDERDKKRGPGEYQNDDFVVADSDDDADFADSDTERKKTKTRKRHNDDAAEPDELDKLEAKIEADERKRKEEAGTKPPDVIDKSPADENAMDIESEDDDEWGVRRVGAGSRRKHAVGFEEEEEE